MIGYILLSIVGLLAAGYFLLAEQPFGPPPDPAAPRRSTGDLGPGVSKVHPKCPTCTCKWIDPTTGMDLTR